LVTILDAIFDISKCSMMPEWHHSDFSRTMYALQESTKKKKFKIKFQVLPEFAQILPDYFYALLNFRYVTSFRN